MGIFLAAKAWMVPFLKTFGVDKGNGLSPFAISIDRPHTLGELGKEYFKIPTLERRGYSIGKVDEYEKEEVYDDVPSVGNDTYNTDAVVENHYQKIKKSEVDIYLNATDNNAVEENTVNENTQE